MIGHFHKARKNEEGQALILASITLLILALCVLATINIAYAASERIQLQNTADSAAYTSASYQARALNFLAYTNRAMIVQYVGQMNLLAILTEAFVNYAIWQGLLGAIKMAVQGIPIIGTIIYIIITIIQVVMGIVLVLIQLSATLGVPIIDAYNFGTALAQAGVVNPQNPNQEYTLPWELSAAPGQGLESFVNGYNTQNNTNYQVTSLSSALLNVDETTTGYTGRWGPKGTVVNLQQDPVQTSITTGQAGYDRLQMIEMANAARSGWTAHGEAYWTTDFGIPRGKYGIGNCPAGGILGFCAEKLARTEWGALSAGDGKANPWGGIISTILGPLGMVTEQFFSLDRFLIEFSVFSMVFGWTLDSWAYADRGGIFETISSAIPAPFGGGMPPHDVGIAGITQPSLHCFFLDFICQAKQALADILNKFVNLVTQFVVQAIQPYFTLIEVLKFFPLYHFGMMPYAKFRPANSTAGPGGALGTPSAPGLFNQPPVALMVTEPQSMMPTDKTSANSRPFLGGFGFKIGGYSSSGNAADPTYQASRNRSFSQRQGGYVDTINFNPGDPLPSGWPTTIPSGFHAISAAMAYYHRPGDWREPPNLFNPMWGAKLMPFADYPTMPQNGVIQPLMTQNLLVH